MNDASDNLFLLSVAAVCLMSGYAKAEIVIGGLMSISGPTAAQGIGYRNAFWLFPSTHAPSGMWKADQIMPQTSCRAGKAP